MKQQFLILRKKNIKKSCWNENFDLTCAIQVIADSVLTVLRVNLYILKRAFDSLSTDESGKFKETGNRQAAHAWDYCTHIMGSIYLNAWVFAYPRFKAIPEPIGVVKQKFPRFFHLISSLLRGQG